MPLTGWIRPVSGHGNIHSAVLPPNPLMMHLSHLPAMAGIILFCTVLPACTGASPPPSTREVPAEAPAINREYTSWADLLGPTSAPEGWQVTPCENPMLLCIQADGEILGTVERFSYSLRELNLQGGAPKTPEAQRQFLEAWVVDHYDTIEADRSGADPNLQFVAETPAPTQIGSLAGLRYGYTITHPNGAVFDRTVGYVTTDGEQIFVFVTGLISGDPTGSFSDVESLETFEPYLNPLMEGLRL
ncbi:MAG: hypothetical protein RLZZ597_261 [Cyanobacteriota bacterium]